jgi:hypothetical protein
MISLEGILTVLLLGNIVYLNLYLFDNGLLAKPANNNTIQTPVVTSSPSPTLLPTLCPSCLTTTVSPKVTKQSAPVIQNSVKDYYVSLGSGTSQASDWTDVPGVAAVIDFGQYPHIKEIHFEASVYVPTANEWVSIRLYNETDKHPVWNSQVTTNAAATAYLTSPALNYDTGSKLYQVQMETQLQAPATLVQSRIHIILQ